MADAKEILQLGIEAARDGNREEARNLFALLTKQDPTNIQAWLWLAGVSDNASQRRNALERALQIDPQNEMALRGLRALSGNTRSGGTERNRSFIATARERTGALFGRQATPTAKPPRVSRQVTEIPLAPEDELTDALDTFDEEYDEEPRGPSPLMWGVLGAIALLLIVFLATQFLGGENSVGDFVADSTGLSDKTLSDATAVAATLESIALTASPQATMTPAVPNTPTPMPAMLLDLTATLTSDGLGYGVRDPLIAGDRTEKLSDVPATDRYFVVVVLVSNSSGTNKTIPADFFVLKDDQGRNYTVNVERSNKLVDIGGGRGVVTDVAAGDELPSDSVPRSMALIFDVKADATNLRLYGSGNPTQGWQIAASVQ
jgi:hypothetical protein